VSRKNSKKQRGGQPPSITINPARFVVPAAARDLSLAELPLSVRLEGVLQRHGFQTLGELNQVDESALLATKNCGPGTILELRQILRRAAAGDFSAAPKKHLPANLRQLAQAIDTGFNRLSRRDKTIYQARLPGLKGWPRTLQDIGTEYQMTRERVRQIINEATEKIRRGGGPRLSRAIEALADKSEKRADALTSERLVTLLKACALPRPPHFYLGVLAQMAQNAPAESD
jgi:hypothetical protein